jgi:hypothetical protein
VAVNADDSSRSEVYELWEEADPADFAQWKETIRSALGKLESLSVA